MPGFLLDSTFSHLRDFVTPATLHVHPTTHVDLYRRAISCMASSEFQTFCLIVLSPALAIPPMAQIVKHSYPKKYLHDLY